MVKMDSGIARGRVHTTMAATTSQNMAAVLQLIGHAALVNSVHLWYWTSILWSIDTCQNKVSADKYRPGALLLDLAKSIYISHLH